MQLVDTNVVSELMRPRPAAAVVEWANAADRFALSTITLEELWYGLALKRSARLEAWLREFVRDFCDPLDVTAAVAERAADLRASLRAAGHTRTQADMLIAATAQEHGLALVTRNVRDFAGCGLRLVNPFTAGA